jgi:calcineurin-like phosphoesterase family protein
VLIIGKYFVINNEHDVRKKTLFANYYTSVRLYETVKFVQLIVNLNHFATAQI